MTAFGLINSLAFLAAAVAAGWLARDRATMRKHLPGFVATCVVFGYAFSYGSKWLLYDTVLGLDAHICEGTHFYGTAIGASLAGYGYARFHGLSFSMIADAVYPSILLGSSIGRLACYQAGCCGGLDPTVPVQLFSSSFDLLGFLLVVLVVRPRVRTQGLIGVAAVVTYGSVRLCIEFLRDEPRILFGATLAQTLSILTMSTALLIWGAVLRSRPAVEVHA